jgi:hypothetical protein
MERDGHPTPERVRGLFDQLFAVLPDFPDSEVEKVRKVLGGGEFLVAIENPTPSSTNSTSRSAVRRGRR